MSSKDEQAKAAAAYKGGAAQRDPQAVKSAQSTSASHNASKGGRS